MEVERRFMERALQLAVLGRFTASPNPMVGAVIVNAGGRIIGEGWHRRCGGPHAEVNAVSAVADKEALRDSTMYVTLEPCSHYGRTPPCAEMIVRMGIPRVVAGCLDPFVKVAGRGLKMLREAGVEVVAPFMEAECMAVNRRFMTAHRLGRPYILLKWAQSADGYLDTRTPVCDSAGRELFEGSPARWSTALTSVEVQSLRAEYDAVMTGSTTVIADNPRLTARVGGRPLPADRQPLRVVVDRRGRVPSDAAVFDGGAGAVVYREGSLAKIVADLYRSRGIISLMVEGGASLLKSFIAESLWDEARIEISPRRVASLPGSEGFPRMAIPEGTVAGTVGTDGNLVLSMFRQPAD